MMKRSKSILILTLLCAFAPRAMAQTWTEVGTASELNAAVADGANIRLTSDITLSAYLSVGNGVSQTVTLDLNGYKLKRNLDTVDADGHVIEVHSQGTLTIIDNYGGGIICGGRANNGGGICNYGTIYFQGGTITDCLAAQQGGGIKNNDGATCTMSGGTILGNWGQDCGGIFNAAGGTLTISGGTITGNTSNAGGGGVVNYGTATISGGTISGNHATTRGGGIWTNGTMTITGVNITGNRADIEGGGIWSNGTLNMQGTVTVQNNATTSGLTSNVFLKSGHVITITGSLGSSRIGITVEGITGVFTSGANGRASLDNFSMDQNPIVSYFWSGSEIKVELYAGGVYYVERGWDAVNKKITETLRFRESGTNTIITNTNSDLSTELTDGEWCYVKNNNIVYDHIVVNANAHANLILCDGSKMHTCICLSDGSTLTVYGQLNGSGILEVTALGEHAGIGILEQGHNATLNIHGSTVTAQGGTFCAGLGGSSNTNGVTFNIYGGTITSTGGSRGAGIGSGFSTTNSVNGGNITIYGGYVEAHGGDQGAGIGGGDGANGGVINILGGTVYAYGGDDAAGIGSGQEQLFQGGVNGGTITISGGHVFAYGNDVAAGIGAGEDADMGNITITGGIVEAHGGGGKEWAHAIATNDENSGVNSVILGDNMMVTSERDFTSGERYAAIRDRQDAIIKPCPHNGAHHTAGSGCINVSCDYCLHTSTMPYTFQNDGSWTTASNWLASLTPSSGNNVAVKASATIPAGTAVTMGTIDMQAGGSITLKDGAQLKAANSVPVTVQKGTSAGIWQAIAPPVGLTCSVDKVQSLTNGTYDLLRYNEATATWENQKSGDGAAGFTTLESGRGYIYRRADSHDLAYRDNTVVGNVDYNLSASCADDSLAGFNLVGNPYTHNVALNQAYYSLTADGTWQAHPDGGTLLVGQAALVYTNTNGETLTFTPSGSNPAAKGYLPPLPKALCLGGDCDEISDQWPVVSGQSFVHWDGNQLMVEGTGLLQAYDIMGRLLFSREVNSQLSMLNAQFPNAGVYILRLGEKSQKIVIR